MNSCERCGGAIGEPGKAYGYAGKWCRCPSSPPTPAVPPPAPSVEDYAKLLSPAQILTPTAFVFWLRGYLAGRGNTGDVAIYNELQKVKL